MTIDLEALKQFVSARCAEEGVLPEGARYAIRAVASGWSIGFADGVTQAEADAAKAEKERALRLLARIWVDHPEFQQEWDSALFIAEERAAAPVATEMYEPPRCCGEVCGWAEHAGVWVCHHRTDHRFNDDGVPVDRDGRTLREQQIHLARQANPSRLLG